MAGSVYSRIGYELKRAQHRLRATMDDGLRPLGLSTPQYAILSHLREHPGASGARLARDSFVTAQAMNDLLVGLERAGLIRRTPSPRHGRVLETHLTAAGERRVEKADAVVNAVERRLVSGLTPAERQTLSSLLRRIAEGLEAYPGQ